jgi:hypothetical protein
MLKPESIKTDVIILRLKQDGPTGQFCESKVNKLDNPFIDNNQRQTVVDMRDVMVLNDIIEQAAVSGGSDRGGKLQIHLTPKYIPFTRDHNTPSQFA